MTVYISNCINILDADVKGLCGMYQRIIMIPRPDYASRVCKYMYTPAVYYNTHNLKNLSRNQFKLSTLHKDINVYQKM